MQAQKYPQEANIHRRTLAVLRVEYVKRSTELILRCFSWTLTQSKLIPCNNFSLRSRLGKGLLFMSITSSGVMKCPTSRSWSIREQGRQYPCFLQFVPGTYHACLSHTNFSPLSNFYCFCIYLCISIISLVCSSSFQ